MKLIRSAKSKITKNGNSENAPNLEITEVVLQHCNIVNNNYQQDSKVLYTSCLYIKVLFLINNLVSY